jgi:hypothetical protein
MTRRTSLGTIALALLLATPALAQQPSAPAAASARAALAVGRTAPDFALPGATRFGLLRDPVRLSDYHGKTIILALFPKARTKG